IGVGMRLERGCPKSLFRPGSSTVVLLFQSGRVRFCQDILANLRRTDVRSYYSEGWGPTLVETDVAVRSTIARAVPGGGR
ncbi:MAG: phosphatidylserine decarboxylase, partial [bacterium]